MNQAKERFEQVKKAVARLHEVQMAIMNECDDWRPSSASSKHAISDPTANRAIRYVDEIEARLATLRAEESELTDFIGDTLVIIQAVRDGLGVKYGDVLEWRYIDCESWGYIRREYDVKKITGYRQICIAFDWIDSLGVTRILAGDYEI